MPRKTRISRNPSAVIRRSNLSKNAAGGGNFTDFFDKLKEYEGMKPGLSRIKKFLKSVGNPQDKIKCFHIAGTNGKGSTAAFLSSALQESGYKTALYTSPHLTDITERVKINGQNVPKTVFDALSKKYITLAEKYKLSYFEYLTALAFVYFASQKIDVAALEAGLGGRFDATNAIKKPLASIIVSIGADHKEILGNSISKIAFEKAGIIKKGRPAICGDLPSAALKIIRKKADVCVLGKDFFAVESKPLASFCGGKGVLSKSSPAIRSFDYYGIKHNLKNIKISLPGAHQIKNAALALRALETLNEFDSGKIKRALRKTKCPARLDIRKLSNGAELLIDGAHNTQAVKVFVSFAKDYLKGRKAVFIFAVMKEKEYKKIIREILPFAKKIILPDVSNKRAAAPETLEKEIKNLSKGIKTVKNISVREAVGLLKPADKNIALGSFYLAGEILGLIRK